MNALSKKSVAVYLMAVFLIGAAAGGFGGYWLGIRKSFSMPAAKEIAARMTELAKAKLHLTDEQIKQIQPIINETAAEFEGAHYNMTGRVNEIIEKANQRIAPFLTPEQKVLLDELDRQRREQFREALKPQDTSK